MPAAIRTSGQMWNAAGEQQDTKCVIPDSCYARALRRDDRPLPRARRVRPGDDGHDAERRPDGAEGRGVRLARQDVRDRRAPARCASSTPAGADAARARRSRPATSGACARRRTRRSRTGSSSRSTRARATGAPAVFWLDETRAARRRAAGEGPARRSPRSTPTALQIEILPVAEATRFTLERARARRGHDLGDRQRPARLPHRPVPDPRARHEREDALDRPAHERRRPVRDGRRRLGAQARPAVRAGEPPALGLARRVPRAGRRRSSSWPSRTGNPRAQVLGRRRSTARPARCSRRAGRRRARSASSTTAAATSTSRCTGRRSWPAQTRGPRARGALRAARASGWPTTEATIVAELDGRAGRAGRPRRLLPRRTRRRPTAAMRPSATLNAVVASIS